MPPAARPPWPGPAWITGARGLIGRYLLQSAPAHHPFVLRPLTRADIDLTDAAAVQELFAREKPQWVIHCAALSGSEACQANPALAWQINVEATRLLATLSAHIPFFFLSSDLVFDGQQGQYTESDPVGPLSVYAETKVAAEQIVLANPRHTVVRTSLNLGYSNTGDRSCNEQMRRAWLSGRTLRLFTDEFRSPIPAAVTAQALWTLVNDRRCGLYHVAGLERLSRYQLGQLIAARHPELNPRIDSASRRDYPGSARPHDASLNCAKAQALLPFPLPALTEWLAAHPHDPF